MNRSDYSLPSSATLRRVSNREHCPICDHSDWCELRSDGAVHCMRVESAIPSNRGGGWWHNFPSVRLNPDVGLTTAAIIQAAAAAQPSKPAVPIADIEVRSNAYTSLLFFSPLSAEHTKYLESQGIEGKELQWYGTLGESRGWLTAQMRRFYGIETLCSVPGFYLRADDTIAIASPPGLLVAVRDEEGHITAMQCRVPGPNGSKQYLWLSSSGHNGASSGSPAHYSPGENSTHVYITEGAKKAHIASLGLGCGVIGLPGHANHKSALALLVALRKRGTLCATIALDEDEDPVTAGLVDKSRGALIRACLSCGLAVRVARWDPESAKGIDDLCLAGLMPRLEIVTDAATMTTDPSGGASGCLCKDALLARALKQILASNVPDTEKIAYMGAQVVHGAGPAAEQTMYMDQIVQAAGMTSTRSPETARKRAGQALLACAEWGLLHRDASDRNPENLHVRLKFSIDPACLPLPGAQLPLPERKVKDAARKRACPGCGSTAFRVVCVGCGLVQSDSLEDIVASGTPVQTVDESPTKGTILDKETLKWRNPEIGTTLFPDSATCAPVCQGLTPPSADLACVLAPVDYVVLVLQAHPEGLPYDYLLMECTLESYLVRQGVQLGMRARRIRREAPRTKGGAEVYYAT